MQTLSEKAKGKQRADPIREDAFNHGGPIPPRQLMVRFTEGVQDLVLHIAEHDSVRDVKAKIREARPKLQHRRLRLIHAGRLLADGTHLESWLSTLEERQQRAAATKAKDDADPSILSPSAPLPSSAAAPGPVPALPWLHCSVGAQLSDGDEDGEVQPQVSVSFSVSGSAKISDEAQIKPLRGFDRLAAAGFSEDDILNFEDNSIRAHPRTTSPRRNSQQKKNVHEEHARALEEQWIDALGSGSAGAGSGPSESDSRGRAVLNGIVIGFFFPLLPFFFFRGSKPAAFWDSGHAIETAESTVFSRRMQMGLVVGFIMNVMFGMWRYLWGTF
ncbi:hypothetical protein BJV77DRAFT_1068389 [Russula vinacea]|nr:hypothetical protein BJV77DRAFT_1068389 [Russula vinacea]